MPDCLPPTLPAARTHSGTDVHTCAPQVITIRSTAFEKVEGGSGSAAMEKVECEVPVAACVSACLIIDDSPACALD